MNMQPDQSSALPPLVAGDHDFGSISDLVCGLVERPRRAGGGWRSWSAARSA